MTTFCSERRLGRFARLTMAGCLIAAIGTWSRGGLADESSGQLLWQIGSPDNDTREFALAPNHYDQFREDGFFVVGSSDPARDWPYVQPGPADGWAGARATRSPSCLVCGNCPNRATASSRSISSTPSAVCHPSSRLR